MEGKRYCSQRCMHTVLPKCELCERPLQETVTINGHVFCRQHATGPRCFSCMLPFTEGYKLEDGRQMCDTCHKTGVFERDPAMLLYRQAYRGLREVTGRQLKTLPTMKLVDAPTLGEFTGFLTKDSSGMIARGFYRNRVETAFVEDLLGNIINRDKQVTKTVYLLYGLERQEFLATAVHELTHDLLTEHFRKFGEIPLWAEEGICQYVAAMYARQKGFADELAKIEAGTDPIYGHGYQYMKRKFGSNNWSRLQTWLSEGRAADLPAKAPAPPRR
ncbi:MAG: hypothetical protein ACI8W8_002137 [Rhodothermales bacterium]|jgi:hypothetical protein